MCQRESGEREEAAALSLADEGMTHMCSHVAEIVWLEFGVLSGALMW